MSKDFKSIVFWLTPQCNLHCRYCFQTCSAANWEGENNSQRPAVQAREGTIGKLADFCLKNKIGHVEFFGGEPLFNRDLFEYVVRTLHGRLPNLSFGLVTNGTLLNERIMLLIEECSIAVLLSLDGGREGHNRFRGGFETISPWFKRLQKGKVSIACQAGAVDGLYYNIRAIWECGFRRVFINVIENRGWYTEEDLPRFEEEYEQALLGMLRGEGVLNCAVKIHKSLLGSVLTKECGIVRRGLASDWEGVLYPCHRAIELGPDFAIGSLHAGVDTKKETAIRKSIEQRVFQADHGQVSNVSFCPVSNIQACNSLDGEPNWQFCKMIDLKHKLVAKHHYALESYLATLPN